MLRTVAISTLFAVIPLLLLRTLFSDILPPVWPDEALFSSPAAALVRGEGFVTPVLTGLIPGMETATLWNSPLYIVFLSLTYLFTGESLIAGRTLSLIFALMFLILFSSAVYRRTNRASIAVIATVLVALDLTFIRASNMIRMDSLALLFGFWSFITSRVDRPRPFRSGVLAGLAGLSHPIGIYAALLLLVRYRLHWQSLLRALFGIFLVFVPWLIYISIHFDIFQLQFLAQMTRKAELSGLVESETGGALRVYLSQYGGGALSMWIVLLFLTGAVFWQTFTMFQMARRNRKVSSSLWSRRITGAIESVLAQEYVMAFFGFLVVLGVVLLSSEGWYALHAGPFLIYSIALFVRRDDTGRSVKLLWITCAVFAILPVIFYSRAERSFSKYSPETIKASLLLESSDCKSILLRSVPDPYFWLRKDRPDLQILEFIPAKLNVTVDESDLYNTYSQTDCFFLNRHHSWNPVLKDYMENHADEFEEVVIESHPPAESPLTLYRKVKNN